MITYHIFALIQNPLTKFTKHKIQNIMSKIPSVNQEALARYRHIRDSNARYSIIDESSHAEFFNDGFLEDEDRSISTHASTAPADNMDWSVVPPPMSPVAPNPRSLRSKRISKYHGENNMKSPLQNCPAASVDRSLRSPEWVGGYTPVGYKKPKRSWKLKNPADEIYLTHL